MRSLRPPSWLLFRLAAALALASPAARAAEQVAVAAAANLVYTLDALDAAFARARPGVSVTSELGATGSLVAQIANGAPFDVFLAADLDSPRKLAAAGGAEESTLTVFAIGRLVLWTTSPRVDLSSVAAAVRDPAVVKIAIANPDVAPYGRAARQAVEKLGLAGIAREKWVVGESISQAAQYVESGNADAGFVALSLVLSPKLRERGRWIEVPRELYAPITQGAVLTLRGAKNPAARAYLEFLRSAAARDILARFGYVPPSR